MPVITVSISTTVLLLICHPIPRHCNQHLNSRKKSMQLLHWKRETVPNTLKTNLITMVRIFCCFFLEIFVICQIFFQETNYIVSYFIVPLLYFFILHIVLFNNQIIFPHDIIFVLCFGMTLFLVLFHEKVQFVVLHFSFFV